MTFSEVLYVSFNSVLEATGRGYLNNLDAIQWEVSFASMTISPQPPPSPPPYHLNTDHSLTPSSSAYFLNLYNMTAHVVNII